MTSSKETADSLIALVAAYGTGDADSLQVAIAARNALPALRALAASEAARERAERERNYEVLIVNRIWKTLGIETYEEAKPFAIHEHVAQWIARAQSAESRAQQLQQALNWMFTYHGHSLECICVQCENARALSTAPAKTAGEGAGE